MCNTKPGLMISSDAINLLSSVNPNISFPYFFVKSGVLLSVEKISNDTYLKVFENNLINTKFDFENYWEIPMEESWYNRFL